MIQFVGKRLLFSEMNVSMETVKQLEEDGLIKRESGFISERSMLMCRRCGTNERTLQATHHCAKCDKMCTYCRNCLRLGKVSECEPLYHWIGPVPKLQVKKNSLAWTGELSSGQKKASDAVINAIAERKSLLVWAVCGSGKTEILFRGLDQAFANGQTVLLATPRVDVVRELFPRLRESFPSIPISALYGGSKDITLSAQLVIATTHQTMRYAEAFDVVIIDEVDAFPYSIDRSLQYAISQAKKPDASVIYLTATPSKSILQLTDTIIKIPKRYHGFPLPEPTFQWCGNWFKALNRNKLPTNLLNWIERQFTQNKPILLFVPTITILQSVSTLLAKKSIHHATVHAKDKQRHKTISAFREQRIPLLITTTILERGVTFPRVQVAILGAEHDVFTEAALVQIAGRVGRSKDHPHGDVLFYHHGISKAMRAARHHIKNMNREGGDE